MESTGKLFFQGEGMDFMNERYLLWKEKISVDFHE